MATTGDLASLFGVSTQTIRVWSREFKEHLSDDSQDTEGGKTPRHFTDADVQVMLIISDLRTKQKSYDEIRAALTNGTYELPDQLAERPQPSGALTYTTEQLIALVSEQRGEMSALREERDHLRKELEQERKEKDTLRERAASAETEARMLREVNSLRDQTPAQEQEDRRPAWWQFWKR